jgi:polar amino acid transport system substrate-binding protein
MDSQRANLQRGNRRFISRRLVYGALLVALVVVIGLVIFHQSSREDVLRWGGDQEGGGPYIYPKPSDPAEVTGFEVDLMEMLAGRLGLRSQFRQCEWLNLPDLLRIGDIDCITNGYELTEAHLANMLATIPYYVYELQLVARRDDPTIVSWASLARPARGRKKKVGVLGGSAAETYVRKQVGDRAEVVAYQGSTDAMQEVVNGKLDATVQDLPPLIFYRDRFPTLHFVGPPVGRGYYVIYLRPGEERLRDALNTALLDLLKSGKLRSLYERYGLWNKAQEDLGTVPAQFRALYERSGPQDQGRNTFDKTAQEKSTQASGWDVVWRNLPILLQAAGLTVLLSCLAMPLAILGGLLVALGRLYGPAPLRFLLGVFVEVLRGTPLLLQLFTLFFILPAVGIRVPAFLAAVLGLAINYSAYEAEIYRAGLRAIPVGQMEAALALGMSRRQALLRVIIPQAVRLVIPPVTNDFVALFKDTSICSVITIVELTKRYSILANSTGAYLELAVVTAALYLLMSYPLSLLARYLEGKTPRQVV